MKFFGLKIPFFAARQHKFLKGSLLMLLSLVISSEVFSQTFYDDFIRDYEGTRKRVLLGYSADQWKAVTDADRVKCEQTYPGLEANFIIGYRFEGVDETATFSKGNDDSEADLRLEDEQLNPFTEVIFCSADNSSSSAFALSFFLELLVDSASEPTETATLELHNLFSGELLDTLPVQIKNVDPGVVLSPIPATDDPGHLDLIAGGNFIGVGTPAITSYLAGTIAPLNVDSQGRVYFLDDGYSDRIVRRIELDGTLSDFKDLGDYTIFSYFVVKNDRLYFKENASFYEVDLQTREVKFLITFRPPAEHGCCNSIGEYDVDSQGVIYHMAGQRLYRIDPASGETSHYAGSGPGSPGIQEGVPATNVFIGKASFTIDPRDDSVLVAPGINGSHTVSRIDPDTQIINPVFTERLPDLTSAPLIKMDHQGDLYMLLKSARSSLTGYVYRYSESSGLTLLLGNGGPETFKVDGETPQEIGVNVRAFVVDSKRNLFISSRSFENEVPNRIQYLDTDKNIVSTVAGAHGFLGCASATQSRLEFSGGMGIDANGIVYAESGNAILAIDLDRDIMYSVAGIFSAIGVTADGEPAFGNRLTPTAGSFNLAVSPEGDLYVAEEESLRVISRETGLLGTLAEGTFWSIVYHPSGYIYALSESDDADDYNDIVRINIQTGQVSTIITGGSGIPVIGESANGRNLGELRPEWFSFYGKNSSLAVDSSGYLYLTMDNRFEPDFFGGIYKINPQTKILTSVLNDNYIGDLNIGGQVILDEANNALYFSSLDQYFSNRIVTSPLVKVDLSTGDMERVAGGCQPDCVPERYLDDPLKSELGLRSIVLAPNGDLFGHDVGGKLRYTIVRVAAETRVSDSLIPGDIATGSNVGQAVARFDNWLAVGVPNSSATGGGQGEVLLYQDNDCRPILQERLNVPDGYSANGFGQQLAFAGDALVIGAAGPASSALQTRSSVEVDAPFSLGVFGVKNGRWGMRQALTELIPPAGGTESLIADGENFALGSPEANGGGGEVTIFSINDLDNPVTVRPAEPTSMHFGKSLALSDGHLVVGADQDASGGVAELFEKAGTGYLFAGSVVSPEDNNQFAVGLALNDEALYVGAPNSQGGRVFDYTLADLALFDTLSDPNDASNPTFGQTLDIEQGVLVVGAPGTLVPTEASSQVNEVASLSPKAVTNPATGAVIAFGVKDGAGRRTRGSVLFSLLAKQAEAFGEALDISDGRIVVGAPKTNEGRGSFESVGKVIDAAQLSGLWYDPEQDGEGYNLLVAPNGIVVFYYGYGSDGERLWLISETVTGDFQFGEDIHVPLYKALEGDFDAPRSSGEALIKYGLLSMSFGSLRSATFTINGFDGNKISRSTFLADTTANSAAFSGLWYDPSKDGEGYNVISGKFTTVVYYYGSTRDGERLWLISDGISNDISDGFTATVRVYEAIGGDFFRPEPSATSLRDWGTIEVRFDDCDEGRFILTGSDGSKTSSVIKLAGVAGAQCNVVAE